MPKFDPTGDVAQSFDRTPGRWLVEIPETVKVGKDAAPRAGIEHLDEHGQPKMNKAGHEMWTAAAVVIDAHPEAPRGAVILGLHLNWGGKGRDATYALLKAQGHPVDAWKRETDPAKIPDLTPAHFYNRRFVLDCALNDKGYLEPNGFMPYYPASARTGPAPAGAGSKKKPLPPREGGHGGGNGTSGTHAAADAGGGAAKLPF